MESVKASTLVRVRRRQSMQRILLLVVLVTIGLGWWIPWLGFSVPIVMITGVAVSLFRGRYVCGNLCPRGSFYDRIVSRFSRRREISQWLRSMPLRWTLFAVLMGLMVLRILQSPLDPLHWGRVFWMMCVVTTAVGIPLALYYHPRAWCSFCPIGTAQAVLGRGKLLLRIDGDACRACGNCETSCTMGLSIAEHRDVGVLPHRDCVKCSECIAVCPADALAWPSSDVSH
jgi:ferredoxin-type protein NapH